MWPHILLYLFFLFHLLFSKKIFIFNQTTTGTCTRLTVRTQVHNNIITPLYTINIHMYVYVTYTTTMGQYVYDIGFFGNIFVPG